MDGWYGRIFSGSGFFDMDKPIGRFTKRELHDLLYREPTKIKVEGINLTYEGLIPKIQKSMLSKDPEAMQPHIRAFVERAITFTTCPECDGTRLSKEARSSRIQGKNIADVCAMQISDLAQWVRQLDEPSVAPLLAGLQHLLDAFAEIGLGYLSLDRPAGTLSGGEAQRTKMIRHLGSSLTDITYVFDEPTIGLHPHDIERMNRLLAAAARQGQHRPRRRAQAGDDPHRRPRHRPRPGAGSNGGTLCFEGTVEQLRRSDTITGRHFDDRASLKSSVRSASGRLEIRGASTHNLRDVDVDIPLGLLCVVTGVAGSGKSSLVQGSVAGSDGVVVIDQGAIRGSRRSNPATYTGLLEPIRKAFAKANGVKPALFSSNSEGACPTCNGAGVIYTNLGVMATVESTCEDCEGRRFQASVLEYRLGGQNIADVLAMSATEAQAFFGDGDAATPGRPQGPRTARRRRVGLPQPRATAHHPLRRRAAAPSSSPPRWVRGAASTCSTSPPPACTSPTSSSCWACWTDSSTPAGRSSSSNTTRPSWPTPTGSSTSAPGPVTTVAGSSSKARPPSSSRTAPRSPASIWRPTSAPKPGAARRSVLAGQGVGRGLPGAARDSRIQTWSSCWARSRAPPAGWSSAARASSSRMGLGRDRPWAQLFDGMRGSRRGGVRGHD